MAIAHAEKKIWYKRWWVWVLIIFIGLPMFAGIMGAIFSPSETPTTTKTRTAETPKNIQPR